jgi:hypothetical protein
MRSSPQQGRTMSQIPHEFAGPCPTPELAAITPLLPHKGILPALLNLLKCYATFRR